MHGHNYEATEIKCFVAALMIPRRMWTWHMISREYSVDSVFKAVYWWCGLYYASFIAQYIQEPPFWHFVFFISRHLGIGSSTSSCHPGVVAPPMGQDQAHHLHVSERFGLLHLKGIWPFLKLYRFTSTWSKSVVKMAKLITLSAKLINNMHQNIEVCTCDLCTQFSPRRGHVH